MANRLATLLGNTKTRTMVLLVLGILIFGVVIAVSQTDSSDTGPATQRVSKTTEVPNQVKSTPGSEVTRNYQELQEKANIKGAAEAAKKGTTFIPTITGNAQGYSDQDFEKQLSSAFDSLGGKCSKEKVAELTKQGMTPTQILLELKSYGCSAAAIAALFTPDQIAAALLAQQDCGSDGNCTEEAVKALKGKGNDITKVVAAMKANGCAPNDIAAALKATGSDAATIATAMKANGIDAATVATALAKAGFSKSDILPALTQAGFSPVDVAKALSALNLDSADNAALTAQQQAQAAASQRLIAQQEAQQLAAFSQQRQGKIQDLITAMESEKKTAIEVWSQIPAQAFQQGEWASKKAAAQTAANNSKGKGKSATGFEEGKVILKAGSILFAVLDTAVNSDQAGPVMATVVAGSLKGSKLLGSMTPDTTSETIALTFSAINMPNEANSMGISAVAIDPDTARTALASDVDHHYLYRWGSLLASSFVQGYASAVASTNSTSTTSQGAAGTVTTTSTQAPDAKQQLFAGISAVGTKWSQVVGQNFDRPITITIDQGTGIGVLITSDLTYGTNPIFYSTPKTSTAALDPTNPATITPAEALAASTPSQGSTSLSNDQRQALLNLLQNQPAAATNTVTTTPAGGTVATKNGGGNTP
jgi:type IV secretory pathway VirB10-like protein